jgi:IS5 family transposase
VINNHIGVIPRREQPMSLGLAERQGSLFDDLERFCEEKLASDSIYSFLHRERDTLFRDEMFSDLFAESGRRSVPPSVIAAVMVLQRLEGLSDREAVERYCFDNRWRYAAGVGGYGSGGWTDFAHTVLVDMRERLRRSERPDRIFQTTLDAAKAAGLVGKKRVLDSTPLYDAVATMDTITLIRSAIRSLLRVAGRELEPRLRAVLCSGDDYASTAKPQIDWDDPVAREELIDSRAHDAFALLAVLDGMSLDGELAEAARLLATVVGQDLEQTEDNRFAIARKVAKDRVISTVDTEARHGHKTVSKGFDGYKGHVAIDPDAEIITAAVVTPGNAGDATVTEELIADLTDGTVTATGEKDRPTVYGDAAYGSGESQSRLEEEGLHSRCKTQEPTAAGGLFTKDRFEIDLERRTVTCPNGVTVAISRNRGGRRDGMAYFGDSCAGCPLRSRCTNSSAGRTISVGRYEGALARARARQKDPGWIADYRANRPKVERKIGHLMRRRHGGRRARVRGLPRVAADFSLLAAAANLARLATLGLARTGGTWAIS